MLGPIKAQFNFAWINLIKFYYFGIMKNHIHAYLNSRESACQNENGSKLIKIVIFGDLKP